SARPGDRHTCAGPDHWERSRTTAVHPPGRPLATWVAPRCPRFRSLPDARRVGAEYVRVRSVLVRPVPVICGPDTRPGPHRAPGSVSGAPRSCWGRSEEHTSELQSRFDLVCRLLLEKKKITTYHVTS